MAANSQFSMAVHILAMLARSEGENVKSECLAGSVNTNAVVVRRLLGQLTADGVAARESRQDEVDRCRDPDDDDE
jgi:DNA-binding IscR family transcriptional regulator